MCKIIVSKNLEQKKELAKIARRERLFVCSSRFHLSYILNEIINCNCKISCIMEGYADKIGIAYENNIPVGVCVLICDKFFSTSSTVEIFVRKSFRRLGIGSALLKKTIRGTARAKIYGFDTNLPCTSKFWNKNKIKITY